MQENPEQWMKLVELARNEQNPDKLIAIVREVDRLLAEKKKRLDSLRLPGP